MTLEQELEKLEIMLGFEPLEGISHPNPKRKYPGFLSKLWKKITGLFSGNKQIRGEVYE